MSPQNTQLDAATLRRLDEAAEYFATHDIAAARAILAEVVKTVAANSTVAKQAHVRVEVTCRGCGKPLIKTTRTMEVRAGIEAPTLVLRGGLNPHTCEKRRRGLFTEG